jgi:hypothetical protein
MLKSPQNASNEFPNARKSMIGMELTNGWRVGVLAT